MGSGKPATTNSPLAVETWCAEARGGGLRDGCGELSEQVAGQTVMEAPCDRDWPITLM